MKYLLLLFSSIILFSCISSKDSIEVSKENIKEVLIFNPDTLGNTSEVLEFTKTEATIDLLIETFVQDGLNTKNEREFNHLIKWYEEILKRAEFPVFDINLFNYEASKIANKKGYKNVHVIKY